MIGAIEGGKSAAVDALFGGATPFVSPTVISEFSSGNGDVDALNSFLSVRGGGVLGPETEGNAVALQDLATSIGRSLGYNDAAIGSAAQSMGIPVITNDTRFANFLNQVGIGGRGFSMAVFNWVEETIKCPVCSETTLVRAQVHVAASFDRNDEGRFCDLTYSIGDKIR